MSYVFVNDKLLENTEINFPDVATQQPQTLMRKSLRTSRNIFVCHFPCFSGFITVLIPCLSLSFQIFTICQKIKYTNQEIKREQKVKNSLHPLSTRIYVTFFHLFKLFPWFQQHISTILFSNIVSTSQVPTWGRVS